MESRKRKNNTKILFTGGHGRSTAFAVIQEIQRRNKKWELCFVGAKSAMEGKSIPTLEEEMFPNLGVEFHSIFTGRVQRRFTRWTIPSLLKIPFGFFHAFKLLIKIKPDLILSFGGFSAFPVVVVGWLLRVPVVIHEQTSVAGRANRYSAVFAKKIALSRDSSKKYFKVRKVVVTGNPVSMGILKLKAKNKISDPPNILITGGQTGSVAINEKIVSILPALLKRYKVVHQVGRYQYTKFLNIKRALPPKLKIKYLVYPVVDPIVWYKYVEKADIIVSRSGANAMSEALIAKRPSIVIPLPYTYLNEQKRNALFAKEFGIAKVLDQMSLTPQQLLREINHTKNNWDTIIKAVKNKKSPDIGASKNLVDLIEKLLN